MPAFGTLLIPIGAASLGLGLSGVTGDALLGLGLGGATLLGLGSFLNNRPRQMAYLAGASAVDCAIRVTRPLSRTTAEIHELQDAISTLDAAVSALTRALDTCLREKNAAAAAGTRAPVSDDDVRAATTTLASASLALGRARAVARSMNDGSVLVDSVNRIRDEVNREVAKSEPDLQRLTADLQKTLSASAGPITGKTALFAPRAAETEGGARAAVRPVPCTATGLAKARIAADDAVRPVLAVVTDLEISAKIETCHQSAAQALSESALRVQPPDNVVLTGKTAVKSVLIVGGQPPTTARMLPPGDSAVELTIAEGGALVTAKPKLDNDAVVEGNYQMLVSDSTVSGRVIVNVEVKK